MDETGLSQDHIMELGAEARIREVNLNGCPFRFGTQYHQWWVEGWKNKSVADGPNGNTGRGATTRPGESATLSKGGE